MKKLLAVSVVLLSLYSCQPMMERWSERRIKSKEDYILAQVKRGVVDSAGVVQLLNAYESFADKYPANSQSVGYLYKAADFYVSMGKPLRGITLYQKIYDNYPNSEKRAYALFVQGYVFEDKAHNYENAQLKYHQFLREYPNHPLAKDVTLSLMNLGKTPEQMVAEFEARQQQQDSLQQVGGPQ